MLALLVCAALLPTVVGDPTRYTSASGHLELAVQPIDGLQHAASYALCADGVERWRAELPFVLDRAAVAEDGQVAGVARCLEPSGDAGTLDVVLISPEGRLVERVRRPLASGGAIHATQLFFPRADEIVLQPELGRFVVRVADGQPPDNVAADALWVHDLATGAALATQWLDVGPGTNDLLAVRAVPETRLLVLAWSHSDYDKEPTRRDALFELRDAEGAVVWKLELAHDLQRHGDAAAEAQLRYELRQHPPILELAPGTFEVRSIAGRARIRFAIDSGTSDWSVHEVARAELADPDGTSSSLRPRILNRVALPCEPRMMNATLVPGRGRILVQPSRKSIQVLDLHGRVVTVCSIEPEEEGYASRLGVDHEGRVVASYGGRCLRFGADGVAVGSQVLNALQLLPRPDAAGAFGDNACTLVRFDDAGAIDLRIHDLPDGTPLRNVAYAVARDGRIAVLHADQRSKHWSGPIVDPTLAVYDADGHGVQTLVLAGTLFCRTLSFEGDRVLLGGGQPQLLELDTGRRIGLELDGPADLASDAVLALAADGRELWMLRKDTLELVRFALEE